MTGKSAGTIYTVGHSTHSIEEFIAMLQAYHIEQLVDIRTVPRSRHNPQFESGALAASLKSAHIGYVHMKALGGLRHTRADSPNTGWRNKSFRGYADYMQTPEFKDALEKLIEIAKKKRTVIMCAEAVPWRCHRSLVGDALTVRGIEAVDIMSAEKSKPHALTRFAQVHGTDIVYKGDQLALELD